MASRPRTVDDYTGEQLGLVRRTLLQVMTNIGDLVSEGKVVVVGGLVPSLLIAPARLPPGVPPHTGTMDLDLGLAVGLRREASYEDLAHRLREAGFGPARTEEGKRSQQTWYFRDEPSVSIDFLMAPEAKTAAGGLLRFRGGLSAVAIPGLHLAFADQERVTLHGRTFEGADVDDEIPVCGAGAFVLLKALAFKNRGNPKDAYDLVFVARYYGEPFLAAVASRIRPLLVDPIAKRALQFLQAQFAKTTSLGPVRVARFVHREGDAAFLDALVGDISRLVELAKALTSD